MNSYVNLTSDANQAARYLREGRIAAFPTGTSYGLAADTQQGFALQRLRNLKKRPHSKTFTVFMSSSLWPKFLNLSPDNIKFLEQIENQPLTVLVKPKQPLEHLASRGLIGLRVIDHPLMNELAQAVAVPLTATSSNIINQTPCFSPACILDAFSGKIDATTYDLSLACILDAGTLPEHSPTTILKIQGQSFQTIRQGEFTLRQINQVLKDK